MLPAEELEGLEVQSSRLNEKKQTNTDTSMWKVTVHLTKNKQTSKRKQQQRISTASCFSTGAWIGEVALPAFLSGTSQSPPCSSLRKRGLLKWHESGGGGCAVAAVQPPLCQRRFEHFFGGEKKGSDIQAHRQGVVWWVQRDKDSAHGIKDAKNKKGG